LIAPLGSATSGRLVFTAGAVDVTLLTEPALQGLVRGRFVRRVSWVGFEAGIVMVGYYPEAPRHPGARCPFFLPLNRRDSPDKTGDAITLNASIPWEIEFRGSTSNLNADLRGLELRSLDLLGGASQINLLLSRPSNATFIYITGGIRDGTIRVPAGVGMRVQVSGGVSDLLFDGQHFAEIGGATILENSIFKSATSRCDICIAGGASNLTIVELAPLRLRRRQARRDRPDTRRGSGSSPR